MSNQVHVAQTREEPKTPEQVESGQTPVGVEITYLEYDVRYHAAHDRACQRPSAELQKRKEARQLAEFGFAASQKRAEAEESRQAEKHGVHVAMANLRKQGDELGPANALAKLLPADFDMSTIDPARSAAAPHSTPSSASDP